MAPQQQSHKNMVAQLFSGPSLTKFLLQSEIQLDPLHPFSKQPGAGPPRWRITILCIVMFHCGPTAGRPRGQGWHL